MMIVMMEYRRISSILLLNGPIWTALIKHLYQLWCVSNCLLCALWYDFYPSVACPACVCVLCAPVRACRSHASSSYVVFFSPFHSLIVLLGEALLDRVCLCVRVCGKTGTGECADFEERSLPVHNTHTSTHTTTKEEQE